MGDLNSILKLFPDIPEWARITVFHLFGVFIILHLLQMILKKLQTPEIRSAISTLKAFGEDALNKARQALELPIERPRLALFSFVLNSALLYVFALLFFACFGIFFMLVSTTSDMSFLKRMTGFGIAAFFILCCRYYFVSAEHQRITAVARWKIMRNDA